MDTALINIIESRPMLHLYKYRPIGSHARPELSWEMYRNVPDNTEYKLIENYAFAFTRLTVSIFL